MTAPDGFPPDMDPFVLDTSTEERLVVGSLDAGDAPPEYRAVAGTLQALRQAPDASELAGESIAVERVAAAVVPSRRRHAMRRSGRSRSWTTRLAAVAVACGLALTGGLAVAGALPDSAQRVASTMLGKVGISVPSGENAGDHGTPATTSGPAQPATGSTPAVPQGEGANGPAVAATGPGAAGQTPPGDGPGVLHDTGARGTPPSTTQGGGAGHSPNGSPSPGAGHGHRP